MIGGGIPLFGRATVQVIETQPVSIHGDLYFDCVVRMRSDDDLAALDEANEAADEAVDEAENMAAERDDPESVQVGEWRIRQPSYRLRLPNHVCDREPKPGDVLNILFIAQQANEVDFLTE